VHINTASGKEKDDFKKESRGYWTLYQKDLQQVSLDESFFFYDSFVRRVWIYKDIKPVVKITGSHKHLCLFGAVGLNGKQLFREYDRFNENNFYNYLKQIHYKFPKCYLFLDKAPQHYKSQKVRHYFEKDVCQW
jgi:hypothetical protein